MLAKDHDDMQLGLPTAYACPSFVPSEPDGNTVLVQLCLSADGAEEPTWACKTATAETLTAAADAVGKDVWGESSGQAVNQLKCDAVGSSSPPAPHSASSPPPTHHMPHGGQADTTRVELPLPIEAEQKALQASQPQMGRTAIGVLVILVLLLPGSILLWGYHYRGWFRSDQRHPNFRFTEMSDFTLEEQDVDCSIDSAIGGAIQDGDELDARTI
jgi:hypothetical protein